MHFSMQSDLNNGFNSATYQAHWMPDGSNFKMMQAIKNIYSSILVWDGVNSIYSQKRSLKSKLLFFHHIALGGLSFIFWSTSLPFTCFKVVDFSIWNGALFTFSPLWGAKRCSKVLQIPNQDLFTLCLPFRCWGCSNPTWLTSCLFLATILILRYCN